MSRRKLKDQILLEGAWRALRLWKLPYLGMYGWMRDKYERLRNIKCLKRRPQEWGDLEKVTFITVIAGVIDAIFNLLNNLFKVKKLTKIQNT